MTFMKNDSRRLSFLILSVFLLLIPLYLYSCSGGGFENPKQQASETSVLISPQTLNGWIINGYGTDSHGFNKMVVLDATTMTGTTSYTTTGHVPGAFLVEPAADLFASRSDGVSSVISEVATRSQIEDVIHRTGIDGNTVIVLTGDSLLNVGTAYFTFRYWGFPKERLKVMNGTNATYAAAGFALDNTVPPAPTASTYSVCQLTQNTSMRASLSDMISLSEGSTPNAFAWDVRTPNEFNGVAGSTTGPSGSATVGYTAFEGHIKGAVNLNYTTLLSPDQRTFLATDTIITALNSIGVTPDKRTHVY